MTASAESTPVETVRELPDLAATTLFGAHLAQGLRRGDVLLLTGDLGAGKTALCRAIIQARAGAAIDVPSPTFNLVLPYDLPGLTITHFDLYRITGPDEAWELGLEDAMADGAVLIEWPERLGDDIPPDALHLHMTTGPVDLRTVTLRGPASVMERLT